MDPPEPFVGEVRVMALLRPAAAPPDPVIAALICWAMVFLVAAALVLMATLTAVPFTTRFNVLLLGWMATVPVVTSELDTVAAVASPAVKSTAPLWVLDPAPLIE